ncbi:MAG TPA: hypothetical protein H9850_09130 [Candidatus Anaerobiospirillum pullistercoris]|uniref:Uncharacterized protein n=1 Tax=Candidatus Anaerobiospirillum pullistercoris TaxID=2838452 RepID=A0A9D1WEP0_9GAMM|nr:hypothetical protein [Candidatus Anaerobiospirillum pullistercoris]
MIDYVASVDAILSYFGATLFVFGLLSCLWRRTFKFGVVTLLLANVPLAAAIAFPKKVVALLQDLGVDLEQLPPVNLGHLLGMGAAIIGFLFCFILFLLLTKPHKQTNYTEQGYSVIPEEITSSPKKRHSQSKRGRKGRNRSYDQEPQLDAQNSFANIDLRVDDKEPVLSADATARTAAAARASDSELADNQPIFPLNESEMAGSASPTYARPRNKKAVNRNRSLHLNSYDNPLNLRAARQQSQQQALADSLGEPTLNPAVFKRSQNPSFKGEPSLSLTDDLDLGATPAPRSSGATPQIYDLASESEPDLEQLQLAGSKVSDLLDVLEHSSHARKPSQGEHLQQAGAGTGEGGSFASMLNQARQDESLSLEEPIGTNAARNIEPAALVPEEDLPEPKPPRDAASAPSFAALTGVSPETSAAYEAASRLESAYPSEQLQASPVNGSDDSQAVSAEETSTSAQTIELQESAQEPDVAAPQEQTSSEQTAGQDGSVSPAQDQGQDQSTNTASSESSEGQSWQDNLELLHVWVTFQSHVKELFTHPENTNAYRRDLISYSFVLETEPPMQSRPLFSVEGFMDTASYVEHSRFTATFHENNLRSLLGERDPQPIRASNTENQPKEIKPATVQAALAAKATPSAVVPAAPNAAAASAAAAAAAAGVSPAMAQQLPAAMSQPSGHVEAAQAANAMGSAMGQAQQGGMAQDPVRSAALRGVATAAPVNAAPAANVAAANAAVAVSSSALAGASGAAKVAQSAVPATEKSAAAVPSGQNEVKALESSDAESDVLSDSVIPNVQSLDKISQNDFIGAGLTVAEALAQLGSDVITTASALEERNKQRAARQVAAGSMAQQSLRADRSQGQLMDTARDSAAVPNVSADELQESQAASLAVVTAAKRNAMEQQTLPANTGKSASAARAASSSANASQQDTTGTTKPRVGVFTAPGAQVAAAAAAAVENEQGLNRKAPKAAKTSTAATPLKSPNASLRSGLETGGSHTSNANADSDYVLLATLQTSAQDNAQARLESYLYQSAPLNINIPVAELNASSNNILGGGLVLTPAAPRNLMASGSSGLTISNAATGARTSVATTPVAAAPATASAAAPASAAAQAPAQKTASVAPVNAPQVKSAMAAPAPQQQHQEPVANTVDLQPTMASTGSGHIEISNAAAAPVLQIVGAGGGASSAATTLAAANTDSKPMTAPAPQSERSAMATKSGTMTKSVPAQGSLQLFSVATGKEVSVPEGGAAATTTANTVTASTSTTTTTAATTTGATSRTAASSTLTGRDLGILEKAKPQTSALVVRSAAGGETHVATVSESRSAVPVQPTTPDANTKIVTRAAPSAPLPENTEPVSAQVPLSALAVTKAPRTATANKAVQPSSGANNQPTGAKAVAPRASRRPAPVLTPVRPMSVSPSEVIDNKAKLLSTLKNRRRLQEQQAAAAAAAAAATAAANAAAQSKAQLAKGPAQAAVPAATATAAATTAKVPVSEAEIKAGTVIKNKVDNAANAIASANIDTAHDKAAKTTGQMLKAASRSGSITTENLHTVAISAPAPILSTAVSQEEAKEAVTTLQSHKLETVTTAAVATATNKPESKVTVSEASSGKELAPIKPVTASAAQAIEDQKVAAGTTTAIAITNTEQSSSVKTVKSEPIATESAPTEERPRKKLRLTVTERRARIEQAQKELDLEHSKQVAQAQAHAKAIAEAQAETQEAVTQMEKLAAQAQARVKAHLQSKAQLASQVQPKAQDPVIAVSAANNRSQAISQASSRPVQGKAVSEHETGDSEHQAKRSLKLNVRNRIRAAAEQEREVGATVGATVVATETTVIPAENAVVPAGADVSAMEQAFAADQAFKAEPRTVAEPSSEHVAIESNSEHVPSLLGRHVPQSLKKRLHPRSTRSS